MHIYNRFFFEEFNQFVEKDNRKNRGFHPITAESLTVKHETIAPEWLVKDATILDLGSCLGATGHWCLSKGAKYYVGVEIQSDYVDLSNALLGDIWASDKFTIIKQDIDTFLSTTDIKFDVVYACGVLYAFLDYFGLLKKIDKITNNCVVIDTSYPSLMFVPNASFIEIVDHQHMNKSTNVDSYSGLGARPTPQALLQMMANLGYENKEEILYPNQLTNNTIHDSYHSPIKRRAGIQNPARFLMRFFKTGKFMKSAGDALLSQDLSYVTNMAEAPPLLEKELPWKFDESVAARFQHEATTHIPDYERVIKMCVEFVTKKYNKNINIIDVGSALGFTVDKFLSNGFDNTFGVEISESMRNKSLHQDKIILDDKLPIKEYSVVLANWTLHFVANRTQYLKNIYDSLTPDGVLIITDKMTQTSQIKDLYYEWKKSNGVSQEVIETKERKLKGVMETKPLSWYMEVLNSIGFKEIEIANSRFNFNTLICYK